MEARLVAALTVLLAGHGLAFAQAADVSAETFGVRGSAEYLSGWMKNGRVPPLVTAGGNGVPGSPGTRVLLDNLDFVDEVRPGGRFVLGYRFAKAPFIDVEASYFFLSNRRSDAGFSSSGDPLLARPFINVATGMPDATLVSSPGIAVGEVTAAARTSLSGAEATFAATLISSGTFHLKAVGGFRYLRLEEELRVGEQFQVFPGVPGFGGSAVDLHDEFRTVNRFFGGQVGVQTGVRRDRLTIDFRGTIGVGQMRQVAYVDGATNVLASNGSTTVYPGGLLALRSNIGSHQRSKLAFIPEASLDVGLRLTRDLRLFAGYSFLWVNTVARAGEQMDPVVNVTQFPILSGNGPLVGPARPAFNFAGSNFWARKLSVGLELRF
jgi:hypothetical protein